MAVLGFLSLRLGISAGRSTRGQGEVKVVDQVVPYGLRRPLVALLGELQGMRRKEITPRLF